MAAASYSDRQSLQFSYCTQDTLELGENLALVSVLQERHEVILLITRYHNRPFSTYDAGGRFLGKTM